MRLGQIGVKLIAAPSAASGLREVNKAANNRRIAC
jgi:hypothetical protein